ncbi:MAG TPA: ParB/RepB/Spo0J family partition protein [Herpetosiphon sp.]|uniref:ParB-like partition protein n=1 Tax=Herpetosiphon aurantiacus (strain ATCC 23779 / DSM 785 / 114-95) TaxID=316274 RepID=A9B289_HERA2|nr:ParB/RepB/Spo0J family partition protein [Herpetosiphon sp.]ABX07439.1 parB-like partition protein [Herpetosiphon aurantiacus DSM 785]HBW51626.1 ParB/RepB/Spo0J family partition protein [Herpetosiphon sp.]
MNPKKRGLGQGLGALIRPDPTTSMPMVGALHSVPIESIEANPHQPRQIFTPEALEELSASIATHGILQPLVVTRTATGYELIAGERRWRAAQQAGLSEVPVIIKEVTPQERLELALVENIQRADLNPLEEAQAYQLLHDEFSLSHQAIAERVGKSRPAITNALRLLKLPSPLQQAVMEQQLTAGHLKQLITIDDERTQILAMEQILEFRLSVREAEKMAQLIKHESQTPAQARIAIQQRGAAPRASRRNGAPTPAAPTRNSIPAEPVVPNVDDTAAVDQLTRQLGTKVEVKRQGNGGYVRIDFYSDEQLIALIESLLNGETL